VDLLEASTRLTLGLRPLWILIVCLETPEPDRTQPLKSIEITLRKIVGPTWSNDIRKFVLTVTQIEE